MNSEAGRLATKIGGHLQRGTQRFSPTPSLAGSLRLASDSQPTKAIARVRWIFDYDWLNQPPTLWCDEPWIRRPGGMLTTNWHILPGGNLCYIWYEEWTETLGRIESHNGTEVALVAAAYYVLNNTRYLLYRHLLGYKQKLIDWPEEWPAYPHGHEAASKEYSRIKHAGEL